MTDLSKLTPEQRAAIDAWPDALKEQFGIDKELERVDAAAATDERRGEYDAYAQHLVDYANQNQDISVQKVGSDPNDPAVKAASDRATKAASDYKAALDNYNYQTQQATQAAGPRPTDPAGAAAYDAALAAQTKGAAAAKATLDAAKAAAEAALSDFNQAKQQSVDSRYLSAAGTKVNAPADVTATTVAPTSIDFNAGLVDMARQNQIGQQGQIAAGSVGPIAGVQAQQIATPGGVSATTISAPTIEQSSIDRNSIANISLNGTVGRDAQMKALQQLQDAAEGKTTSAAEWLMQKGIDENVGAAYGLAASLQGRNTGGALRAGHIAAKDAIAKSAADMGALRAKEQADARSAFATLGTAITETDYKALASNQTKDLTVEVNNLNAKIQVAMKQAELAERAGEANQSTALQASIETMKAQVDVAKSNAFNSLNADIANQTARLDASKADAANKLTADMANQTTEIRRLEANQKAMMDAGRADQADALQAEIDRSRNALEASKANQLALLEAAKATASNQLTAGTESAKLEQANNQFNAGQTLDINKTNVGNQMSIDQTNKAIQMALDQHAADALLSNVGIDQKDRSLDQTDRQLQNQEDAAFYTFIGSLIGSGGSAAATAYTGGK